MKRVVSVSLGSSARDFSNEREFLGETFLLERIGTDGDVTRARDLIRELDGKVACITLGGMDRYLWLGKRRYPIRQIDKLAREAKTTPVVDGSGIKHTLEPMIIRRLVSDGIIDFAGKHILVLSGVDRYAMACALGELGCPTVYGDLIFALGIPIPIRSLRGLHFVGRTLLPIICRLPMSWLYPTGAKQDKPPSAGKERLFAQSEIIAGDWHLLRRYLPRNMQDKIIITNTTTADDVVMLKERGVQLLITTTPRMASGRSPGTNVLDGVLVALSGRRPEELSEADYLDFIRRLDLQPTVEYLQGNVQR
jgi:hypothetical protein